MGHDHDHGAGNHGRAFFIGVTLNLGFVIAEVVFGLLSHSMSLLADAGHNFGDVLGLALAWGASVLARRRPSSRRTYGFRRSTILAALANALLLLIATGGIVWESLIRLREPRAVEGKTVLVVAAVGVLINGTSALLFMKGREHDLNIRSAFLHLAGDAVIALGVVVAGGVIMATGWNVLDPLVSLLLSVLILVTTWSLFRRSMDLVLDAVPDGIDPDAVRAYLASLPGVTEVHDLHIWPMSTTETALTAHLIMPGGNTDRGFLGTVCKELHDQFHIEHATIQVEPGDPVEPCNLASEEAV